MPYELKQASPNIFEFWEREWPKFKYVLDKYAAAVPEDPPDAIRVLQFYHLLSAANKLAEGDYIELGSLLGFTLRVIHKFMDPARTLYSLDTFEGFDERDLVVEKKLYDNHWHVGNFWPTSAGVAADHVGDGNPVGNLKMVVGWFPDSFRGLEDKVWRFVHIDMDLYEPTRVALDTFWPKMVPGGIIMIHDYGCYNFPGVRLAVDQFCEKIGMLPVELADRQGTAVIRKPLRSAAKKMELVIGK